jgi:hypothetical protein
LLNRTSHNVQTSYEIRKYGERFAAEISFSNADDTSSPFRALSAGYIGVFGKPENEGGETINRTAPTVIESNSATTIDTTAPVMTETR